ncbi:MAG TPA: ATPase, T2SS/T4P/T4SS family, partial [Syntrophorhabdales bacterium]|nr:ATPase, T2SS/T4P/T4SS family [Syntrophorhabdales bacterium]
MNPQDEAVAYLKKTELLSGLDDGALERIAATLRKVLYPARSVIVKEGEPGDALYLITRGLVEVKKRESSIGVDLTVAKMSDGACFGEMSLLNGKPRSATVIAAEATEVYVLAKEEFESLLATNPSISFSLNRILAARIEEMNLNRGLSMVSPARLNLDKEIVGLIPEQFLLRHKVLPLGYSAGTLSLAMVNPANLLVLDEVRKFVKHVPIEPVVITEEDFTSFMKNGYRKVMEGETRADTSIKENLLDGSEAARIDLLKDVHFLEGDKEVAAVTDLEKEAAGAPIVRLGNNIIARALKKGASDIHLEPVEQGLRVRYRIDGLLSEEQVLPKRFQMPLISRFKIISGLDITERRFPQDGRISIRLQERMVDFRVSTIPTKYGEKIAVRILTKDSSTFGLDRLITDGPTLKLVRDMIRKPYGIIYVTGPTGSGKTTTLYSALSELHRPEVNIVTVEDPIEYDLPGVAQVQVHPDIGLDFARVLRAFLRQDPDIMLVGETRDKESAAIAIQAALTGHLVFTTLHTNDASSTFIRLMEMDIQPLLISTSLLGVVAQRLVRRICPECKEAYIPDRAVGLYLGLEEGVPVYKGRGCDRCNLSGYCGRVGIYEVLAANEEIKHL